MKRKDKMLVLFLAAFLALALVACGGGSDDNNNNPPTDGDSAETDEPTDGDVIEGEVDHAEVDETVDNDIKETEVEVEAENDTDNDAVATCTIGAKGLALNDACNTNAECESGLCYYFELGYDIPYGVCTKACTAPATKAEENCPTTMTCEKQGTDKLYCTPKSDAQGNALVGPGNGSMDRYEPCWENPDCDSKLCYYIPNSATSFCSLDCSKDATICGTCGSCVETTDSDNKTVHVCVPQGKTATGAACGYELDCASDICFDGATSYCSALCDIAKTDACPTGLACKKMGKDTNYCLKTADTDTAVGETCAQSYECTTGLCLNASKTASYCTQACTLSSTKADPACPTGTTCAAIEGLGSYCVRTADANRATGAVCEHDFNCAGGTCFAVDKTTSYCSEDCTQTSKSPCPTDFNCATVDASTHLCLKKTDTDSAFGTACKVGWECTSGVCYGGLCNMECVLPNPPPAPPRVTDPLIDCPTNFSCKLVKEDRRCFPTSSIGQTLEGAACTYNHECKDGLYCQNYFQAKTNTIIAIYKAGETTPLATNDNISSTDRFSKLTQTFATAGTYYITVKSSGSSTGDYKLTATRVTASTRKVLPAEVEPNETQATATALTIPGAITGKLATTTDVDTFKFDALANDQLTFETSTIITPPVQCSAIPTCAAGTAIATLPASLEGTLSGASTINFQGCTGYPELGPEAIYTLILAAGQSVHLRVSSSTASDLSVTVAENCYSCVRGVNSFDGATHEDMIFTAPKTATYTVVVDSDKTSTTAQAFKLEISTTLSKECGATYPAAGCCLDATHASKCDEYGYLHTFTCGTEFPACSFSEAWLIFPASYECAKSGSPQTDPTGENPRACPTTP